VVAAEVVAGAEVFEQEAADGTKEQGGQDGALFLISVDACNHSHGYSHFEQKSDQL